MITNKINNSRITGSLLGILLLLGLQQPVHADPLISGVSTCWVDGSLVKMTAATWIGAGWYPEVQIIGHINTITQLHAPYLQVFGPYISANTSVGTITWSPVFYASAIPGWYAIETLHGYIDDDATEHEVGYSGWVCYL